MNCDSFIYGILKILKNPQKIPFDCGTNELKRKTLQVLTIYQPFFDLKHSLQCGSVLVVV